MSVKKLNVLSFIISIILICVLLVIYIFTPKLKLETNYKEIEVFSEYQNISYSAFYLNQDITSEVKVDKVVDTSKIGEYKITYSVKHKLFTAKKVLKVKVIDSESPKLDLIGDEQYSVCSLKLFIEPGYSAIDNLDGNITNNVDKKYVDDNLIEYYVKDSSNNETKKYRKLIVQDNIKPEIKLNGDSTIYLNINDSYSEQGASASDNCDGDLTDKIEISNSVDTSKVGEYAITYKVMDSSNNESSEIRKIIVSEKKVKETRYNSQNNTNGVIYLTFDDGPGIYTSKILDILKKYNIKATFFVTKAGDDSLIKREYDEGHTVALHTYTHDWNIYKSVDTYLDDLNKVANRVKTITGVDAKYVRFPGGSSNQKIFYRSNNTITIYDLINALNDRGYKYFDWNVCVEDAGACVSSTNKENCVISYFKRGLHPNEENIVLLHDIKSYTASSLEEMIIYAINNHYTFKAIDDNTTPVHFR